MINNKPFIFEMKCKQCNKYFLYCLKNGQDLRCYNCRKGHSNLEEIQQELKEMSKDEYNSFMEDIKEYRQDLESQRTKK